MLLKEQLTVISTLTLAELKGRYRNTFIGLIWVMINPLILFSVHALIFKHVLKIELVRYYTFLLSGLVPWIFMSSLLAQTVNTFVTKRDALLSFQIHPLSLIISKCLDCLLNFLIPFFFLFFLITDLNNIHFETLIYIPIFTILMFIGTTALATFLAIVQVFFRDTEYILTFLLNILFYLTPIFYPPHLLPNELKFLIDINPLYTYISGFQSVLWSFNHSHIYSSLITSGCSTLIIVSITYLTWKKLRNEIYLNI